MVLNTFLKNLHWHFMFLNQHFTASYKPPDQHFRGRNAEMSVNLVLGKNQVAVEWTASRKRYKIKTGSLERSRLLSLRVSQDLSLVDDHRVERHFDSIMIQIHQLFLACRIARWAIHECWVLLQKSSMITLGCRLDVSKWLTPGYVCPLKQYTGKDLI